MAGASGRAMDERFDTRLLAFGGYFNAEDRRQESRYIMCINAPRQKVFLIQHEQPLREIAFESIMCVIPNLKYDIALCLFLNDGSFPVSFFCDSEQDRNMLLDLLRGIKDRRLSEVAAQVGASADHEIFANKKGKLKWARRYLVLCRSRLLVFRQKTADELVFPLNMLSLLEPNVIIQPSSQHDRAIQITSQERPFHFQLPNEDECRGVIDVLERARTKAQQRANIELKQQKILQEQSRRDVKVKIANLAQESQSRRNLKGSNRNLNQVTAGGGRSVDSYGSGGGSFRGGVRGPAGGYSVDSKAMEDDEDDDLNSRYMAAQAFDLRDAKSQHDLLSYGRPVMGSGKGLKFRKKFKPNKHTTSVFLWGKARPPRLFPQHANQVTPFRHDDLSGKRFVFVTAAKDGTHAFGYTYQDWLFAWGESDYSGALGLGRDIKSTLPFLIRPLRRKKVRQIACSSRHGLALTEEAEVYAWGSRLQTGLPADVSDPKICTFLNNLGITSIAAGPVHSAAWHVNTTDLFTWGMPGSWLGLDEENQSRGVSCPFGRVMFGPKISESGASIVKTECGNQFTMVLFSDGRVCAFGVNEHGRMGIGEEPYETQEPVFLRDVPPIGDLSCGPFHSALISNIGQVYTCGVGNDFRLGHGDEETQWTPRLVEALGENTKIVRIECVEDRTFAVTEWGCVVMWGCEPVSNMRHTAPFVLEYMRPYRIYQISGARDFTVALGVHAKEPVPKPEILAYDNAHVRPESGGMGGAIAEVADAMGGGGMNITVLPGAGHIVTQTYQNEQGHVVPPPPSGGMFSGGMPTMGNGGISQFPGPPPPMGGRPMGSTMGSYPPPPMGAGMPMQRPPSDSMASGYSAYGGYTTVPGPPGGGVPPPPGGMQPMGGPMMGSPMGGSMGGPMGQYPPPPMQGGIPGPPGMSMVPGPPGPPGPPMGSPSSMSSGPAPWQMQTRPPSGSQVRISRKTTNSSNPMRSVPQTSYASDAAIRRTSLSGQPAAVPPPPGGYGPPPQNYGPPSSYGPPGYGGPPGPPGPPPLAAAQPLMTAQSLNAHPPPPPSY